MIRVLQMPVPGTFGIVPGTSAHAYTRTCLPVPIAVPGTWALYVDHLIYMY